VSFPANVQQPRQRQEDSNASYFSANHRRRIVGKHARHRWLVADVSRKSAAIAAWLVARFPSAFLRRVIGETDPTIVPTSTV
jgi:hypothetical protein